MYLGGQRAISAGSSPVGGQRFYWAEEFGLNDGVSSGGLTVTFPNSGFSGRPFVTVSPWNQSSNFVAITVVQLSATQFSIVAFDVNGAPQSSFTLMWRSIGTRTF
jgi:hypothetical protein